MPGSLFRAGQNSGSHLLLHRAQADSVLERLLDAVMAEQRRDWTEGKRIPVSERLRRHPELADEPACAAELIYHEFALRQELGESPDWQQHLKQHPEHSALLQLLRQADQLVEQTLAVPAQWPADTFADYDLLGEVGRGGMGIVFKARQKSLDRVVALKVLRTDGTAEERKRFDREAQAVARLQHANIVQVYEVGETAGQAFVSLEFVDGQSLSRRLDGTPLPARQTAALVEILARAMHYAHEQGIIHRDLKPANVLLAGTSETRLDECTAKIADFGLAKKLDMQGDTQSGAVLGTPSYMSPEQAEGRSAAIDRRTDVYGLGAILYELLTGRPPFRADTPLQTLKQVVEAEPARPRLLNPAVPRDLETVCLKCLQKEPARRYSTAEGLAEDLHCFSEGRPVMARPVSPPERLRRWARRNPLPSTLAVVLALAVTAGLTTALALWWTAERHLREEAIARLESETHYLTCRQLLGEYVAVTRDLRLHNAAVRNEERQALSKARAFCEGLAQRRPNDPALLRVLAEVCAGLAALDARDGRINEALQSGETARALWQQLVAAAPAADSCNKLAGVLSTLGFVYGRLGRSGEAAESLQQALALWEQFVGDGDESMSVFLAACAARRELARRPWELGSFLGERQIYEENCSRLERVLGQRGGPPELRLELLVNLWELGRMYDQAGNKVDSVNCWRRGYDLGRRLIDELPDNGRAVYVFANCGRDLAARDRTAAPPEETARLCEQAARLLEFQRSRDRADLENTEALTRVCWLLSDSYIQAGQLADALRAARRAAAVLAELADVRSGDPVARLRWLQGLARLAVHEAQCGDSSGACLSARQAADGLEAFCESYSANPEYLAIAVIFGTDIAPALRHASAPDQVMRAVQCCLRTSERLVREYPNEPAYRARLSSAWTQAGKANWSERQYEQAEAGLRAAVQVTNDLAERWPEYEPLREDRLRRLGRFLDERSESTAAATSEAAKE